MHIKTILGLGIAAAGLSMLPATMASAVTCIGDCGSMGANGVVTTAPSGGAYNYVSTLGGVDGVGLGLGSETTGSVYTTNSFTAAAGEVLTFHFNYVTHDGAGYADYAWVSLAGAADLTLFTARTTPSGNTVPGFGMPDIASGVTLNPEAVTITPGGPDWAALGSGDNCYANGCGYTGWVQMNYAIETAGTYTLNFGVVNWSDSSYQSGLAWDGALIGEVPIDPTPGIPEPGTWALMIAGFGLVGIAARRRRIATAA